MLFSIQKLDQNLSSSKEDIQVVNNEGNNELKLKLQKSILISTAWRKKSAWISAVTISFCTYRKMSWVIRNQ